MVRYWRLFNISETFSCKIEDLFMFSYSVIKVAEGFPIISNQSVTTRITINYSRVNFFPKWIFRSKQCVLTIHLDLNITFSLRYGKSISIVRLSLVLKSTESLPKCGKTKVSSLLRTMKLRSFLINNLFKNFLIYWFTKFWW